MFQKQRQDHIIKIIRDNGYCTVKYLCKALDYSTATINRDLNLLEKEGLVTRSYGGVELVETKIPPLRYRYDKMRVEKRAIGRIAAQFVKPGETVFIAGSTTTQSMEQFLTDIDGITVITNNISMAEYLSEHGVNVVCLGGRIVEPPSILCGNETVMNAATYSADKVFFSTNGISCDGRIKGGPCYQLLLNTMLQNSKEAFYLLDHNKVDVDGGLYLFGLDNVDYVICDRDIDASMKAKYPSTAFVAAEK